MRPGPLNCVTEQVEIEPANGQELAKWKKFYRSTASQAQGGRKAKQQELEHGILDAINAAI
eukprot:COSAG01_NODE_14490_length_1447_cov_1.910979_1_plen_60_part_10